MPEDIVRDGLVVVAMEAVQERGGGGGRDSALAAQALQSLGVHSSSHPPSHQGVCAGAIRAFNVKSTGSSEVQEVVGYTDVVAEG